MGDSLSNARRAVERGEWRTALDALDALDALVDEAPVDSDDHAAALELRAQAAYGAGEFEAAVRAWEELHAFERARGEHVAAARAAAMAAMFLLIDSGLMAPVRGWLHRAERELEGFDATPAHAVVAMTRTYERFMCGDMAAAKEQAELAIDLGTATDTTPAVVIGRTAAARIRIIEGDLAGGLAGLEEVGALLMSGSVDPLTTGMMYCEVICAAQGLALHDMAAEWTAVMDRWRQGAAFGGINGRCRVHRAELLRISGPCDAAEAEAIGACDELRPWMRREFGWPLVELGNIRLRRGDLAGAEAAFLEAHQHAWSPQPGLALVRLEHGDAATASMMIADAVDHPVDIPSKERPPYGGLRLAPLLDAQAEIASAVGDAATARQAATRLGAIADMYDGPFLRASADLADARADLLAGDLDASIDAAQRAVGSWTELGAPYEAATARLVLAEALDADGRADAARIERSSAAVAFRSFGARHRADLAERLASAAPVDRAAPAPATASSVGFSTDGSLRTIEFAGRSTAIKDLKGLRYVARLVAEPGREFHVLDLVAADEGVLRPSAVDHGDLPAAGGAGLPVLDDVARDAYRRRLLEIDGDIEEARQANDLGRIELAERDREYLVAELKRAVGLGGRSRTVGGTSERARTSVARSIKYGLDRLATVQPELATHLRQAIRTGTYCCYDADPITGLSWHV